MKPRCENCVYFHDKDVTSTGKILGYCDMKDSKRFGLPYGSLRFVVYGDGKCPYFKAKQQIEEQMSMKKELRAIAEEMLLRCRWGDIV